MHAARTLLDASPGPPTRNRLGAFSLAPRRPTFPFFPSGFPFILGEGTSERTSLGDVMGRTASTQETLYYGSTRKHQYWENEKQTLRLVRDRAASVWRAYRKQRGMYRLLLVKSRSTARPRKGKRKSTPLTGRSAEEVVANIKRDYQLRLVLEQRLRRWMDKASGERVLAFLDPNQGGAPAMTDPGTYNSQSS